MGEYEGGFLPRGALEFVIEQHLRPMHPDIFKPEFLQVVGIDVAPRRILDRDRQEVKPNNGEYDLLRGTYLMMFGFCLDEFCEKFPGLRPRMFGRSSNHRVGAIFNNFIVTRGQHDDLCDEHIMDGEVFGLYDVVNPYGVVIEEGAGVAQLGFSCGVIPRSVSEHLVPSSVEQFMSPGQIGRLKTTVAETRKITPQQLSLERVGWELEKDTPYFVRLGGAVSIPHDQVYTPSLHRGDDTRNPALLFLSRSTCLADPGYIGSGFGMTLLCTANGVTLGKNDGLLRFRRERVLHIEGMPMAGYDGQWQETPDLKKETIAFRDLNDWGLTGGTEPSLEEISLRIREAGISV